MTKFTQHIFILFFVFHLISDFTFAQNHKSSDFLFPIDIKPVVSGSFAELRSHHFHSGVDLSTNGKTGLPVKSMEKGVIARIKVSPVGYGNAIYVKHPNGYTTVYGHLKAYAPKIDSLLTIEQYKIQSFAIDYFPTEDIFIERGEIIGYSGNSGSSGGPHLHYEIRDSQTEKPINPFLFQTKITDDIRPKIMSIRLYPLNAQSTINGDASEKNYPVVFYDNAFHLKSNPTIYATGQIGVGIEMLDYMSGSWKKCGVYKLDMYVNEQKWYGWQLERFSFDESRYINSHIDYAYKKTHGKRIERCFRQPNNLLSIYNEMQNDGIIKMDSTKNIQLIISDAALNLSKLNFKLHQGKTVTNIAQSPPVDKAFNFSYKEDNRFENDAVNCFIPKGALYDDMKFEYSHLQKNGLPIYQIGDDRIPLHKSMTLSIKIPDSLLIYTNKLTLATINGAKKTVYAGGTIKNENIELYTKYFGNYTFAIDSVPPSIKTTQSLQGNTFSKQSKLTFKIHDDFSGIKSYNGYLNDKWTLFEYDAKTNTLTCPLAKAPIKPGRVQVKLIVIDNCENKKELDGHFILK